MVLGNCRAMYANRLSFSFDLHGCSVTVDAGDISSLTLDEFVSEFGFIILDCSDQESETRKYDPSQRYLSAAASDDNVYFLRGNASPRPTSLH